MEDGQEIVGESSELVAEEAPQKKQETRDQMLSRHRKETSDLQYKETELQKGAAKGSKAEQKAKKKQVEEEVSKLSAELKEKQANELASLGYNNNNNNNNNTKNNLDTLVKAIAGVSVGGPEPGTGKSSKGNKRREKRAQQEADRERRIHEEQSKVVSERAVEDQKLKEKLAPLGLVVKEMKPDGHCLYRAVGDQLGLEGPRFQELREMAARYMRTHADDFIPFFLTEKASLEEEEGSGESPGERFEKYCEEVESTAVWGGQLEIGALSNCLRKHVLIFSGSFPDVEMGKEYKSGGDGSSSSVRLSFHKHAFGLGEHYNSVVPI